MVTINGSNEKCNSTSTNRNGHNKPAVTKMTTNRSTVTATKNITINRWQHPTVADKGSNSNWWQKIPPVTKVQQSTGNDKITTTGGVGDKKHYQEF